MIKGKSPIDMIILTDLSMTTTPDKEDMKFRALFLRADGVGVGEFEGSLRNCVISEATQKLFEDLYTSLEKDIYNHIFSEVPEEREQVEQPKTKLQQLVDGDMYDV
jgi:hypothetical protein